MNKKLAPEELGPVDTGPEIDWWHLGWYDDPASFCGATDHRELGDTYTGTFVPVAGERYCPDCLRIDRQMR